MAENKTSRLWLQTAFVEVTLHGNISLVDLLEKYKSDDLICKSPATK